MLVKVNIFINVWTPRIHFYTCGVETWYWTTWTWEQQVQIWPKARCKTVPFHAALSYACKITCNRPTRDQSYKCQPEQAKRSNPNSWSKQYVHQKNMRKQIFLLFYAYPCVQWLHHKDDQLPSLATFTPTKKKATHTHWAGCWLVTKAILDMLPKRKVHTSHQKFLSIPYCFVEQMQGFVIKKMVQEHSQHTSNQDMYHFFGPHIPKKLISNYGVAREGKIWKMRKLQNDFQLFLTEKHFAAFTFSIFLQLSHFQFFPPPPSIFVPKNKMSLVHPLTTWLLMEGKGGTSECSRQKHPKATAFSISCTRVTSPQN